MDSEGTWPEESPNSSHLSSFRIPLSKPEVFPTMQSGITPHSKGEGCVVPDPDLASQSTWHPIKQLRAFLSLWGIPCTCCRHSDLSILQVRKKPHQQWGLSPAALSSTRTRAVFPVPKPAPKGIFHSTTVIQALPPAGPRLSAPLSDNFIVTLGCSHIFMLSPPSPLHCHSSASWERLCAPPLHSFLLRMIFSQPPLFFPPFSNLIPTSD